MTTKTGFVYHERFLDHDTGPGHPERPDRLVSIVTALNEKNLWSNFQHLVFGRADEEWVLRVHSAKYFAFVRDSCNNGIEVLDHGDTHVCRDSFDVAMLAVGGVLAGVDSVLGGTLDIVFCAVRPPGHHAERDAALGFCLFNNVAVAARYAQERFGVQKIAIVDWDVHHGNGTQHIFYEDPTVFYISTHQYPFYPGTGNRSERGDGKGEGYTLNIPMRAGSGEKEYVEAFQNEILPALDTFGPELVIISAGFDAHKDDPLANINLTEQSFAKMTAMMIEIADKHCDRKIVSVLEGGYNLEALAGSVEAHVKELMRGKTNS